VWSGVGTLAVALGDAMCRGESPRTYAIHAAPVMNII